MNALWMLSCSLSIGTANKCIDDLTTLSSEISRNLPHLDSLMFITHNQPQNGQWDEPPDFFFEPSPIWHDTSDIITDDAAKVWLQNKISKSRGQLESYRSEVEKRRKDVEAMRSKREKARNSVANAGGKTVEEMEILRVGNKIQIPFNRKMADGLDVNCRIFY